MFSQSAVSLKLFEALVSGLGIGCFIICERENAHSKALGVISRRATVLSWFHQTWHSGKFTYSLVIHPKQFQDCLKICLIHLLERKKKSEDIFGGLQLQFSLYSIIQPPSGGFHFWISKECQHFFTLLTSLFFFKKKNTFAVFGFREAYNLN